MYLVKRGMVGVNTPLLAEENFHQTSTYQGCAPKREARSLLKLLVVFIILNAISILIYRKPLLVPSVALSLINSTFQGLYHQETTVLGTDKDLNKIPDSLDIHKYVEGQGHTGETIGSQVSNTDKDIKKYPEIPDIHKYKEGQRHTREATGSGHPLTPHIRKNTIAIGGGITSAKIKPNTKKQQMNSKCPIFSALLPSFCETCSTTYSYHFYLAYDYTDPLFSNPTQLQMFSEIFHELVTTKCPPQTIVELHMIQCNHTKKPAWAQNDAMMEAYIDNMEYFYRINDDSRLDKPGWTDIFVKQLSTYDPPNVGVVGPNHNGGNMQILTYDFTHHTHQDMFGFHYPRDFPDWFADEWITGVYQPHHMQKMKEVPLWHTMQLSKRYKRHFTGNKLQPRYQRDKPVILRYVKCLQTKDDTKRDPSKVIALSLYDINPSMTYGALRNVQQAPVCFPEWTVRVYVPSPNIAQKPILQRMLNKMETLGAKVYFTDKLHYAKEAMAFHVTEDPSVSAVLIRNPEFRLSDRQKSAVDEWMESSAMMHCMRDHETHAARPIVPGLLGFKLYMLRTNTHQYEKLKSLLDVELINSNFTRQFETKLWKEYRDVFMCHDSVGGDYWANSKPFPEDISIGFYEGQRYNEFMDPVPITTTKSNG